MVNMFSVSSFLPVLKPVECGLTSQYLHMQYSNIHMFYCTADCSSILHRNSVGSPFSHLLHFCFTYFPPRIYDYQSQGMAFTAVEDLLRAMDEQFVNYTRISARTMFKDAGLSDIFIDELVMGALRDNCGQTPDVHGFVGALTECFVGGCNHVWW